MRIVVVLAIGAPLFALPAAAQTQVAIVEEVTGKSANLEFMDYVATGRVIKLGATDRIVLSYLKSCVREVIVGGVAIVGTEQSDVALGNVQRSNVRCDGGQMQLTSNQTKQSAGIVLRNMGGTQVEVAARPQIVIYGRSPVFELAAPASLIVERTDRGGERLELKISPSQLTRGRFYDSAKNNSMMLTPGGTYVASVGTQSINLQVHPEAQAGDTPVVGRLLRFPPAKPTR